MINDASPFDFSLLSICALVSPFDAHVLTSLASASKQVLETLFTSVFVTRDKTIDRYHLQEDLQRDVLAELYREQRQRVWDIHAQAFVYFLEMRACYEYDLHHDHYEQSCLKHLDKLFFFHVSRGEWQHIGDYITQVQRVGFRQAWIAHRLAFYEGHIALKTQQRERAQSVIAALLDHQDADPITYLRALNSIALMTLDETQYDRALEHFERVYELACAHDDYFYQGIALVNIGMIYNELGYYEKAIEYNVRSLHIFRELYAEPSEAYTLYELGNASLLLGRWNDAKEYFDAAKALYENMGITSSLGLIAWGQGVLYHVLNDERASEAAYLYSLDLLLAPERNNQKTGGEVYWQLGLLYQTQERWHKALHAYDRAYELTSTLRRPHWLSLIVYQRGNVFKRLGRIAETEAAYREAIDLIERLRGATEGDELKIGLLGTTQQIYESMILLCLEQGRVAEAFAFVERARSQALLDTLVRKDPALYAALDQPVVTLRDVQRQLPPGTLLVEYFTIGVVPRGEHMINNIPPDNTRLREHLTLPPRVIVFAITHDRCDVHQLDQKTFDPNALRPSLTDPNPGRKLLHERRLPYLYAHLLGPVEDLSNDCTLLYLVPHGPLHLVPFMALRSAEAHYLVRRDGPAVALAPSATLLLRNCLGRSPSHNTRVLALGYDHPESGLCYAEAEAHQVARLMDGEAWTGADAKSEALFAVGRELRWLHIASHSVYTPRAPLDSHLFLGSNDRLSARTIMQQLDMRSDGVTLSACTSGLGLVAAGDELLGMQRAWLYAGAPTIVCTLWETDDLAALVIMAHFYTDLRAGLSAAVALRNAQVAVRELTFDALAALIARWRSEDMLPPESLDALHKRLMASTSSHPFAEPHHWAAFMLVGRPA